MSDLQDIIVTSSVKAFNSGLAHGVTQERDRIIQLLEENDHYSVDWLIELIKGELK